MRRLLQLVSCVALLCGLASPAVADWPTFRGNPQRTGNVDGKPGPEKPTVLWVYKSLDHFIASPVPAGDKLLVSGIGVLGPGSFNALALEPKGEKQLIWTKGNSWLQLPSVSSPAVQDGMAVFGDAMHQHSGAHLYVWGLDGNWPIYEMPLIGNLYHLESSPTLAAKKAYFGCGNGGALCVDLDKLTLEGKALPTDQIQKELDKIWDAMNKQYEIDFKKDPIFTIKPSKDKLPRPSPTRVWQEGVDKWHVDAPVNLIGDRLLFTSAFLDKEMSGDRAAYCLDAKTGKTLWRVPLPINSWGGATAHDKVVVVTGSTIAYDPKEVSKAKGFVAALNLETGFVNDKFLWQKDFKGGGIQSCAAIADGKVIVTTTDGKVRAYGLTDGISAWDYNAGKVLFAPPAVVGGTVYVGDLTGVVHAINLNNGQVKWTLNLGTDPAVKLPGMIYGGPVVHEGRVYVATCNHAGGPGRECAVVCIGQ